MKFFNRSDLDAARGAGPGHLLGPCDLDVDHAGFAAAVARGSGHLDVIRRGVSQPVMSPVDLEVLAEQGTSLRVRRIHILDDVARNAAFAAHASLDEEINVNAYWSPARSEMGLAPHTDSYDIVVVQVAGEKRWTLLVGDETHSFTLPTGQAFFLPRGVRHRAVAEGSTPSLHYAFGIYHKTVHSQIEWLATELAREVEGTEPLLWDALESKVKAHLAGGETAARYLAYRQGVEHERMLMTPDEHARSDARRYR